MMKNIITFDESLKREMLEIFDFAVDNAGYIVEAKDPSVRAITPDGEDIHLTEWAGLMPAPGGGLIFVKNDLPSMIKALDRLKWKWAGVPPNYLVVRVRVSEIESEQLDPDSTKVMMPAWTEDAAVTLLKEFTRDDDPNRYLIYQLRG